MAERRPVTLVGGKLTELPSDDTIAGETLPLDYDWLSEDWYSVPVASGLPAGLTEQWTGNTYAVQAAGLAGAPAGKELKFTQAANGVRGVVIDSIGSVEASEILTLMRVAASSEAGNYAGVILRAGGAGGSMDGYSFKFSNNGSPDLLRIHRYDAGSGTVVGEFSFVWEEDVWYWMRARAVGDAISVKVWELGDPEPDSWLGSITDSTHTSGLVGFFSQNASADPGFGYFSVGLDGCSAPLPWEIPHRVTQGLVNTLKRGAADWASIPTKGSLVNDDEFLAEDSAASGAKKRVLWSTIVSALTTIFNAVYPALSILTTRGDIIYRNASTWARLAKGTVGHVLTMGTDDPEWAAPVSGPTPTVQVFSSPGTWTRPANCRAIKVSVVAGGGRGGDTPNTEGGPGGGAGGGAIKFFPDVTPPAFASAPVSVGAGGSPSPTTGGPSNFGSAPQGPVSATGGGAGPNTTAQAGGAGGAGSNGDINMTGQPGSAGGPGLTPGATSSMGVGGGHTWLGFGRGGHGTREPVVAVQNGGAGIVVVEEFY